MSVSTHCPNCGCNRTRLVTTYRKGMVIVNIHECKGCGDRFSLQKSMVRTF